jgi:hypothetical protein
MDREQLRVWIEEEGLSLNEIGALVQRDPSTVGYWAKKHALTPNGRDKHAPRGGIDEEVLRILCEAGGTLEEIAEQLERSVSTVRYWIDRYGLPWPREVRRKALERALAEGNRSVVRRCKRHGETEFAIVGSARRLHCKRCRAEAVARRRRRVKQILVEEAGGRCQLCGYDGSFAALEFHHLDPTTKAFGVGEKGITRAIDKIREEARKCVLLCANCHSEVEAGFVRLGDAA